MGRLAVRLQPRSSSSGIYGERDGVILARVNAPPVDGKANRALVKLVAGKLGIAKSRVSVVRGESSRDKLLEIESHDAGEIRRKLLG